MSTSMSAQFDAPAIDLAPVAPVAVQMAEPTAPPVTVEYVESLAEDFVERELIRGELKERAMTYRNRFHVLAVARLTCLLGQWLDSRQDIGGVIASGEVGCILRRDPDTLVGIDVAYFSREVMAGQTDRTTLVEGVPTLAIEVLSPSDRVGDIADKVREYLSVGVALVWIVDPHFRTVVVHRPDAQPEMFNVEQSLTGSVALPGLRIAVADVFRS